MTSRPVSCCCARWLATAACLTLAMLFAPAVCSAGLVFEADFDTPGDGGGFIDFMSRGGLAAAPAIVAGGTFSGIADDANRDVQLRTEVPLNLEGPTLTIATVRYRETTNGVDFIDAAATGTGSGRLFGGDVAYSSPGAGNVTGTNGNIGDALSIVDDTDGFLIATWDIGTWFAGLSGAAVEDGDLDSLRFDPVIAGASVGATFDVDYIRILAVPEPSSLLLFGGAMTLLGGAGRRRG